MSVTVLPPQPAKGSGPARIVYILYLIGLVFGLTAIIGLIIAYVYRSDAPDWLRSHYHFQIRTFWIGLLYLFIGSLLTPVLIGYFVLLFAPLWLIIRCITGLKQLGNGTPLTNPHRWLL